MADTAKHTAGPWLIRKAANGDRGISAPGTGIFIEVFTEIRHSGEGALDECEANARLVAAAPRLIAAIMPFAAVFEKDIGVTEDDADLFQVNSNNLAPKLTVGDFRKAFQALCEAEGV